MAFSATGTIANGSAEIVQPDWAPLTFSAATGDATVSGGNLLFTVTGLADITATITLLRGAGAKFWLGYSWDGGPIETMGEFEQPGSGALTVTGEAQAEIGGLLALFVTSDDDAAATYWSAGSLTVDEAVIVDPSEPVFPAFTPILPPPPVGVPPPPTFPPTGSNTAPVPVPVGPLADPIAIGPPAVPPSVAGVPQPQFGSGSATAPPVNGYFPEFTTTPPSPPIVITQSPGVFGIFNNAVAAVGATPPWTWPPPPSTSTPPVLPTTLMSDDDNGDNGETARVGAVHSGHARPAKRRRRAVLSAGDPHP